MCFWKTALDSTQTVLCTSLILRMTRALYWQTNLMIAKWQFQAGHCKKWNKMTHRQNTAKTSKWRSSRQDTARSHNDTQAEYCKTLKMTQFQAGHCKKSKWHSSRQDTARSQNDAVPGRTLQEVKMTHRQNTAKHWKWHRSRYKVQLPLRQNTPTGQKIQNVTNPDTRSNYHWGRTLQQVKRYRQSVENKANHYAET